MQMSPEEQQKVIEDYYEHLRLGLPISKEMFEQFQAASLGIANYTERLNAAAGVVKALGKAFGDYSQAVYKGKKGMEVMGDGVETVTNALETFGIALVTLGGPIGLLAGALGLAAGAAGKYIKATTELSDKLYDSWTDLSKVGGAAAGGITDVYRQMQQFGLSLNELGEMTDLIGKNSSSLAALGGTVADGAKLLADGVGSLRDSGFNREFMAMGHSINDINKYAASYVKQQVLLGRSQTDIQKTLTSGTIEYAKKLDALSRITGDTLEAQEEKQQAALAEDQYAATMDVLRERAKAGDKLATNQLEKIDTLTKILPAGMMEEIRKGIGGDMSAISRMMMTLPDVARPLFDESKSVADVLNATGKDIGQFRDTWGRTISLVGNSEKTFYGYNEMQKFGTQFTGENADEVLRNAQAQRDAGKALDKTTQDQIDARLTQQKSMQSMQDFVKMGIEPATSALKTLSDVVDDLLSWLPGVSSKKKNEQVKTSNGMGTKGAQSTATVAAVSYTHLTLPTIYSV